jgi:23S rRNA (cytosine1962-C5)-methyltransferase
VRRVLSLRRPLRRALERGHPWVYDKALGDLDVSAGEVVTLAEDGRKLATAFVDPRGPIRARVLALAADADVGPAWARARARVAAGHRALSRELGETDALRAVHGENDAMPGLTVDVYAGVAVVVFDGDAAARFWRPLVDAVLDGVRDGGIAVTARWVRATRGVKGGAPGAPSAGIGADVVPALVRIREGAAHFDVDVRAWQKTGFFLDMRANRARVGALARGARVLNLCAYTGGFSVLAGLGGAARVTSVDLAAPAIAAATAHWTQNGLAPASHVGVTADAFEFLERAAGRGERWDLVIADPPSFAASEAARPRALNAYERLNRLALAVTAPGGLLVSASCSSHVTEADLRAVVAAAAARPPREPRVLGAHGAAADHPTLPGFPEGKYLKLLISAV